MSHDIFTGVLKYPYLQGFLHPRWFAGFLPSTVSWNQNDLRSKIAHDVFFGGEEYPNSPLFFRYSCTWFFSQKGETPGLPADLPNVSDSQVELTLKIYIKVTYLASLLRNVGKKGVFNGRFLILRGPNLVKGPKQLPKSWRISLSSPPKTRWVLLPPRNFRQASTLQTWNFRDFPSRRPAIVNLLSKKVYGQWRDEHIVLVVVSKDVRQQDLYKKGGICCVQCWSIPSPHGYSALPKGWKINEINTRLAPSILKITLNDLSLSSFFRAFCLPSSTPNREQPTKTHHPPCSKLLIFTPSGTVANAQ